MIRIYGSNSLRRCKIFLNEPPVAKVQPDHVEHRTYTGIPQKPFETMVAIELFVARGATFSYGLLGGTFVGNNSTSLAVEISCSEDSNRVYGDPLSGTLSKVDIPMVALPREFLPGVIEGIENLLKQNKLYAGNFKITHAVWGSSSSSHHVFRSLSASLLMLIAACHESSAPSDQHVQEIIDNYIN
jgi:hypothetical protein